MCKTRKNEKVEDDINIPLPVEQNVKIDNLDDFKRLPCEQEDKFYDEVLLSETIRHSTLTPIDTCEYIQVLPLCGDKN